jgi:toxin ParE1/3/4
MTYSIHPAVQAEYDKAFIWLENREKGLGNKFSKEIFSAISQILSNPDAYSVIDGHRKYVMKTFPYKIIYKYYKENQTCSIVAIAHDRRQPDYWKDRT